MLTKKKNFNEVHDVVNADRCARNARDAITHVVIKQKKQAKYEYTYISNECRSVVEQ